MRRTISTLLAGIAVCAPLLGWTAAAGPGQAAQASNPPDLATIRARLEQAGRAGDHAQALDLASQMVAATEPDHIEALYTLAGFHARIGHREQAYLFLSRAIGAGFWDRDRLRGDEAFKDYREDDLFKSLTRRAWARGYFDLLERPNREDVQKSPAIMKALAFRPGERVADIGAGSGYFTRRLAKAVAPSGRVYAVDIQPEMIGLLKRNVEKEGLTNVVPVLGTGDDPRLPKDALDWILLVDVYHELQQPQAMLALMRETLRATGRVALIEYRLEGTSALHIREEHRMSPRQVLAEWEPAGFRLVKRHEFLPTQHFFVFEKAKER
jgi:ubiquinone/menaquinone biosynthesis C-methylase UbiE